MAIIVTGDGVVDGEGVYENRVSAGADYGGSVQIYGAEIVKVRGVDVGLALDAGYGVGILGVTGADAELRVYGDIADDAARVNIGAGTTNGRLYVSDGGRLVTYPGTTPGYDGGYVSGIPSDTARPSIVIGGDGGFGYVEVASQTADYSVLEVSGAGDRTISIGEGEGSVGYVGVSVGRVEAGRIVLGSDGGIGTMNIREAGGRISVTNSTYDSVMDIGVNGGYGVLGVSNGVAVIQSTEGSATLNLGEKNGGYGEVVLSGNGSLYLSSFGEEARADLNVRGGVITASTGTLLRVTGESAELNVGDFSQDSLPGQNVATLNVFGATASVTGRGEGAFATVSIGGAGREGGQIVVADIPNPDPGPYGPATYQGTLSIGGGYGGFGGAGRLLLGGDQSTLTVVQGGAVNVYDGDANEAIVVVGGQDPRRPGPDYDNYGYPVDAGGPGAYGRIFVSGASSSLTIGTGPGGYYYGYELGEYGEYGGGVPVGLINPLGPQVVIGDGEGDEGLVAVTDGGAITVHNFSTTTIGRGDGSEGLLAVTGEDSSFVSEGIVAVSGDFNFDEIVFVLDDGPGPGPIDAEGEGPLVIDPGSEFDPLAGGDASLIVNDGATFEASAVAVGRLGTVSIEGDVTANFVVHGEFGVDLEGVDTLTLTGSLSVASAARVFIDIADFGANDGDTITVEALEDGFGGGAVFDTATSFYVIDLDVASDVVAGDVYTFLTADAGVEAETRVVFDLNRGLAFELASTGSSLTLTALEDSVGVTPVLIGDPFNRAVGGAGREELRSLYGDATLLGGGGDDTLIGVSGDLMTGGRDDDLIIANDTGGFEYSSRLYGGEGDDTLITSNVNDLASGNDGDDLVNVSLGVDVASGGDGRDTLSFVDVAVGVQFDLAGVEATGGGALVGEATGFEDLIGTTSADTLFGDDGANLIDGGRGADDIEGRDGDDLLIGGKGVDTLDGGDGDDTLDGGAAGDLLIGGGGENVFIGGFGVDTLQGSELGFDIASYETSTREVARALGEDEISAFGDARIDIYIDINGIRGSDFNDTLGGGVFGNLLEGGLGDDILLGFGANDTLRGEGGNDTIDGGSGGDVLEGGLGDDSLDGGTGSDVVIGGDGNDTLFGGFDSVSDFINGGDGDDLIFAAPGDDASEAIDTILGGDGEDTLTFENEIDNVQFDLAGLTTAVGAGRNNATSGVEHVFGGAGADFLRGDDLDNRLEGGAGIDRLIGRDGDDTLVGGADTDLLRGGDDDDLLNGGADDDTLEGDAGADTLIGGEGADSLVGGDSGTVDEDSVLVNDRDVASYETASGRVRVDLLGVLSGIGDASGDVFDGIEDLTGGDFNDTLFGDDIGNIIDGGADGDFIRGKGGDDTILGGGGDDTIRGDDGSDNVHAGDGDDYVKAANGFDTVEGGAGADSLYGGDDGSLDLLTYAGSGEGVDVSLLTNAASGGDATGDVIDGFEDLTGSQASDRLEGDAGNNAIAGLDGDDVILGRGGTDDIFGGDGNDTISAGGGANDFIVGGGGADVLLGNGGNDAFVFMQRTDSGVGEGQRDVIRDFSEAQGDTIDFTVLSSIDENGDFDPTAELAFVGTAFSGDGSEVIANVIDNDFTLIQIDFDGDQVSDFEVEVDGVHVDIGNSITFDFI